MGRSLCALFYLFVIASCSTAACAASDAPRSIVRTVAGDGRIGIASGDAMQSHFVLPVGVSVAPDGTTIIVDAGDDAIYRLKNGTIVRIAGTITPIHDIAGTIGGYRDGPVAVAQFNRPTAALERPDGALLVADSGNHCIRLIDHGTVSTYAGSLTPGTADGERHKATFNNPNGLAFASDGSLLISDFGVGIRRIATDGIVSTLPFGTKTIYGIAAARLQGHDIVAFTDRETIHLVTDGKDQLLEATRDRMPHFEGVPVFHGWGIAILNENTVAVADAMTSVIRLVRFPSLPFTDQPASEALSGTLHEDTDFHGGFRDGVNTEALYHAPRGIALDLQGRLVIADSGNRRIRLLTGFDARESVLPDFSNFTAQPGADNLVFIGQSELFNGVLWPDSVPANAQATFSQEAATDRIAKPVYVEEVRADGIGPQTMFDLADQYIVDRGQTTAIAFFFTWITYPQVDEMVREANKLAHDNIRTIVYVLPEESGFTLGDFPFGCGCVRQESEIETQRTLLATLVNAYRRAGLQTESFVDDVIASQEAPDAPALYDVADTHYTPAGQRLLGQSIAKTLIRDRAWLAPHIPELPDIANRRNDCPKLHVETAPLDVGLMSPISIVASAPKPLAPGDTVAQSDAILLDGWAFARSQPLPARRVCPVVDGSTGIAAYGDGSALRFDVFKALNNANAASAGFRLHVRASDLAPGPHTIGAAVILGDGKAHPIGTSVDIVVK